MSEPPQLLGDQGAILRASVFRRRGKKRSFQEERKAADSEAMQSSMDELQTHLAARRKGKDLATAVWQPELRAARVLQQKGRLVMRMGFTWGGKLYLQPEEAMYLVDRGNLLLFAEQLSMAEPLSVRGAFELMTSSGISAQKYQLYCSLMRAGFKAYRHPTCLALARQDTPWQVWGNGAWSAAYTGMEVSKTPVDGNIHEEPAEDAPPPRPVLQQMAEIDEPPPSEPCDIGRHPTLFALAQRLPRLQPFRTRASAAGISHGCSHELVYDVFKFPSDFKRKQAEQPVLHVYLCEGNRRVPSEEVLCSLAGPNMAVPVALASISGEQVSFFCLPLTDMAPLLAPSCKGKQ